MPLVVQREDRGREQFKVFEGAQYVGRIYETKTEAWYWTVEASQIAGNESMDGVADTRVDALAELKAAWERVGPSIAF